MIIYGIATRKTECFGHGDYESVEVIERVGAYKDGNFHPFFTSRKQALAYIEKLDNAVRNQLRIVEAELKGVVILTDSL